MYYTNSGIDFKATGWKNVSGGQAMETYTAVGIDLGGTNIRLAFVDRAGNVSRRVTTPTPYRDGPSAVVGAMKEALERLMRETEYRPCGIGIGAPGPLDPVSGIVRQMPNLKGFENYPLKDRIREETGLPVELMNDADAAAIGEYHFGAARGWPLFALLTLGTGLGSSVVVNGSPWLGEDGFSPELGHLPVFESGRICGCGGMDHAETRLSSEGLWRRYEEEGGVLPDRIPNERLPVMQLFELSRKGDSIAQVVLHSYGKDLGRIIAAAAASFNLHRVILAGGISAGWESLESSTLKAIRQYGFEPLIDRMEIRRGLLGGDAALAGAGMAAMIKHA